MPGLSGPGTRTGQASGPAFTVVIPARNEAASLPLTLRALERQTLPPREVIVVDHASTDGTGTVARAWGARVVACREPGIGRARQAGLEAARTDWVATTDADSLPAPGWLAALAGAAPGRVALYGPLRFCGVPPLTAAASEVGYRAFLRASALAGRPNLAGANMAYSRAAALLAGGYPDAEALEDVRLGLALARLGEVAYVPAARVETSARRLSGGVLPFLWRHLLNLSGHTRGYFDP